MGYTKAVKILNIRLTRKAVDYKPVVVVKGQAWVYQLLFFCNLVNCLLLPYKILLTSWIPDG